MTTDNPIKTNYQEKMMTAETAHLQRGLSDCLAQIMSGQPVYRNGRPADGSRGPLYSGLGGKHSRWRRHRERGVIERAVLLISRNQPIPVAAAALMLFGLEPKGVSTRK